MCKISDWCKISRISIPTSSISPYWRFVIQRNSLWITIFIYIYIYIYIYIPLMDRLSEVFHNELPFHFLISPCFSILAQIAYFHLPIVVEVFRVVVSGFYYHSTTAWIRLLSVNIATFQHSGTTAIGTTPIFFFAPFPSQITLFRMCSRHDIPRMDIYIYIYSVYHKSEYTPHISAGIQVYLSMGKH